MFNPADWMKTRWSSENTCDGVPSWAWSKTISTGAAAMFAVVTASRRVQVVSQSPSPVSAAWLTDSTVANTVQASALGVAGSSTTSAWRYCCWPVAVTSMRCSQTPGRAPARRP